MIETIAIAAAPFILNFVMLVVKRLGADALTNAGLRVLLALFSLIGVVAGSALTGNAIELSTISGLMQAILLAFAAFLASHGSFKLFWARR